MNKLEMFRDCETDELDSTCWLEERLHAAEKTLANDLRKFGILKEKLIDGVNVSILYSTELIDFLKQKREKYSTCPYFFTQPLRSTSLLYLLNGDMLSYKYGNLYILDKNTYTVKVELPSVWGGKEDTCLILILHIAFSVWEYEIHIR